MSADWSDLDPAFTLPDWLPQSSPENPEAGIWRTLYESLLARTRQEIEPLNLLTVHLLLIERYLSGYVCLRYREALPIGAPGGFSSATVAQAHNTAWLALARELNSLISGNKPEDRTTVISQVKTALTTVLAKLDKDVREQLTREFVREFDRAGL